MVWVLSLLDRTLAPMRLTPEEHVIAFGVYQGLIGGEAL
jgi:hypothetical protein